MLLKRGNIFEIYKQQKNEGKCPPFGLFKVGRELDLALSHWHKEKVVPYTRGKMPRDLLEFPQRGESCCKPLPQQQPL